MLNPVQRETVHAIRVMRNRGEAVTPKNLAARMGINPGAAWARLQSLRTADILDPMPPETDAYRAEVESRINAVRAATREKGRPLFSEELNQVLGD